MQTGYDKALYILPFDHRNSYVKSMFHYTYPLNTEQQAKVEDSEAGDLSGDSFKRLPVRWPRKTPACSSTKNSAPRFCAMRASKVT